MKEHLYKKLIQYAKSDVYPFCMPGHKRNFKVPGIDNPYDLDITEVEGFDNLHDPSGIIKELQNDIGEIYRVPYAFLSVNGSSAGMLAAISAIPSEAPVLVARNCHKSVFDGVSIGRRRVYYTYPEEIIKDSMIFGGVDPEAVDLLLTRHPDIRAVVITSPTYEGFLSDVELIAEITHNHGALLIVDEAHGAHMPYHDSFPVSALYLGADIVVQSLHKTLPSLNQTSLVFVNGDGELARRVQRALSAFTTTSPSYGLLASIDYCVNWCVENEKEFDEYVELLSSFRRQCAELKAVRLIGEEIKGTHHIYDVDPSKLLLISEQTSGCALGRYLLKEHKLQMEAAGLSHVLGLTSVMDTEDGFKRLLKALAGAEKITDYPGDPVYTQQQMEKIALLYISRINEVYRDFIYLYPPGCPILAPGEILTKEIQDKVLLYINQGMEVMEWERSTF